MQSMNLHPHVFPIGDQFFPHHQQNDQQPGIGMSAPQMFSPQANTARLFSQQPGMIQNIQGVANPQELPNSYLLKQKLNPVLGQPQSSLQQQQQQQHQQQQQQQNYHQQPQQAQQQNFNIGNPVGVAANRPPGLNGLRQGAPGLSRPGNNNIPKQATNNSAPPVFLPPPNHLLIREVWKNNLHGEFAALRKMVTKFNHVSISTEFVGTIARPIGNFRSKTDYHYQTMRSNVDFLNPIQIGISVSDPNGNKPETGPSTWQFNFQFDETKEMMSSESFELLQKSGINFDSHQSNGVDAFEFAQLMMDSGLLMEDTVTWITYHAAYDFGFLVNMLMNNLMPNNREDFEWWVHKFVPNFYDLNLICKVIQDFKQQQQQQQHPAQQQQSTLASLAEELGIPRFPLFTTTGGQSLLTSLGFSQLAKISLNKLPNGTSLSSYKNLIYGINGE